MNLKYSRYKRYAGKCVNNPAYIAASYSHIKHEYRTLITRLYRLFHYAKNEPFIFITYFFFQFGQHPDFARVLETSHVLLL